MQHNLSFFMYNYCFLCLKKFCLFSKYVSLIFSCFFFFKQLYSFSFYFQDCDPFKINCVYDVRLVPRLFPEWMSMCFSTICGINFTFLVRLLQDLCKIFESNYHLSMIYFYSFYSVDLFVSFMRLPFCFDYYCFGVLEIIQCTHTTCFLCFSPKIAFNILVLLLYIVRIRLLISSKKIQQDYDRDCTEYLEQFGGELTS